MEKVIEQIARLIKQRHDEEPFKNVEEFWDDFQNSTKDYAKMVKGVAETEGVMGTISSNPTRLQQINPEEGEGQLAKWVLQELALAKQNAKVVLGVDTNRNALVLPLQEGARNRLKIMGISVEFSDQMFKTLEQDLEDLLEGPDSFSIQTLWTDISEEMLNLTQLSWVGVVFGDVEQTVHLRFVPQGVQATQVAEYIRNAVHPGLLQEYAARIRREQKSSPAYEFFLTYVLN